MSTKSDRNLPLPEVRVETPKIATKVAEEIEIIMIEQLRVICPDIKPSADSALMITWSKKADA